MVQSHIAVVEGRNSKRAEMDVGGQLNVFYIISLDRETWWAR